MEVEDIIQQAPHDKSNGQIHNDSETVILMELTKKEEIKHPHMSAPVKYSDIGEEGEEETTYQDIV